MNVFGPVPSRRLGRSIGINNIPPKICTYSCVYCQLGRSLKVIADRQEYYPPQELFREVKEKITRTLEHNEPIDYLTMVPDGEPTLDKNLGFLLDLLKPLKIKLAVITNSSLINQSDVQDALCKADWVSVKIDTVDPKIWHKIDRPHRKIQLDDILQGIIAFSRKFKGTLTTETMLVRGINDDADTLNDVAEFITGLKASTSYLSIPTRPPAETWVTPPNETVLNNAFQIFAEHHLNVEYLIGYEGNKFAYTGNVEEDILSITSVHPMRQDAVNAFLQKANSDFSVIEKLISEKKLIQSEYNGKKYYLRKLTLPDKKA